MHVLIIDQILFELHNFNGLVQVLGVLNCSPIRKLKQSWEDVPKKQLEELQDLFKSFEADDNWQKYRDILEDLDPSIDAVVPHYAPVLHKLFINEEKYPTFVDYPGSSGAQNGTSPHVTTSNSNLNSTTNNDKLQCLANHLTGEKEDNPLKKWVNWKKMHTMARNIWEVKSWRVKYDFLPNVQIGVFLRSRPVWENSDIQYEIACLRAKGDSIASRLLIRPRCNYEENATLQEPTFDDSEIAALFPHQDISHLKGFEEGRYIRPFGKPFENLYRLHSGIVHILSKTGSGDGPKTDEQLKSNSVQHDSTTVVGTLIPGTVFGFTALFSGTPVVEPTAVYVYESAALHVTDIETVKKVCLEAHVIFSKINRLLAISVAKILLAKGSRQSQKFTAPVSGPKENKEEMAIFHISETLLKKFKCEKRTRMGFVSGDIFVSQNYICYKPVHGLVSKLKIKIPSINTLQIYKKKLIKIDWNDEDGQKEESIFCGFKDIKETFEYLSGLHSRSKPPSPGRTNTQSVLSTRASWFPTEEEWEVIRKGSHEVSYRAGTYIFVQGEQHKRGIYEVVSGQCQVKRIPNFQTKKNRNKDLRFSNSLSESEMTPTSQSTEDSPLKLSRKKITQSTTTLSTLDNNTPAKSADSSAEVVLQTLKPGDTFGELSFVVEGSHISNASIVAETDVVVNIIEGYYLDVLFGHYQVLEGCFYHHLAAVLETHLRHS